MYVTRESNGVEEREVRPEMVDPAIFHRPPGVFLDGFSDLEGWCAAGAGLPGIADNASEVEELVERVLSYALLVRFWR
jgi:hypothetical protein